MTLMTAESARQLDHGIRQLAQVNLDLLAATRLGAKQVYSSEDLCERYSVGKDALAALLEQHCGIKGERGQRTRVHLEHVLILDRLMRQALLGEKA